MTVQATAKRRRRQARLDKRFKIKRPSQATLAKRMEVKLKGKK